ncbi:hypothetical protein K1719_005281 [Acacia pycnantha]|nr:hypothetical protein K1719_005281 [Acacia pycnantha]
MQVEMGAWEMLRHTNFQMEMVIIMSSGNADYAMACQAMHDLVKIRQNQYDNNIANSATAKVNEDPYSIEVAMDVLNDMVGLEDEEYSKATKHVVESQAWRVAFIKALPERRALLINF